MYAVINDLVPGSPSIVYYIYGNDEHGWSEEQSFRAAPEPVKSARTKILLTADLGAHPIDGTTHHWPEPYAPVTMGRMRDKIYGGSGYDYSLVLHPGDVSYAVSGTRKSASRHSCASSAFPVIIVVCVPADWIFTKMGNVYGQTERVV